MVRLTPFARLKSVTDSRKQMSFDQIEPDIIGHWSGNPRMAERYDRSVCASEPLLRNTIMRKMAEGWNIAPAFHLPATVVGHQRIGEESNDGDALLAALPADRPPCEAYGFHYRGFATRGCLVGQHATAHRSDSRDTQRLPVGDRTYSIGDRIVLREQPPKTGMRRCWHWV